MITLKWTVLFFQYSIFLMHMKGSFFVYQAVSPKAEFKPKTIKVRIFISGFDPLGQIPFLASLGANTFIGIAGAVGASVLMAAIGGRRAPRTNSFVNVTAGT